MLLLQRFRISFGRVSLLDVDIHSSILPQGPILNSTKEVLILGDEPLLFHSGLRKMFARTLAAVSRLMPVERLRWISFGHVETDECGAMTVTTFVGGSVSKNSTLSYSVTKHADQGAQQLTSSSDADDCPVRRILPKPSSINVD